MTCSLIGLSFWQQTRSTNEFDSRARRNEENEGPGGQPANRFPDSDSGYDMSRLPPCRVPTCLLALPPTADSMGHGAQRLRNRFSLFLCLCLYHVAPSYLLLPSHPAILQLFAVDTKSERKLTPADKGRGHAYEWHDTHRNGMRRSKRALTSKHHPTYRGSYQAVDHSGTKVPVPSTWLPFLASSPPASFFLSGFHTVTTSKYGSRDMGSSSPPSLGLDTTLE